MIYYHLHHFRKSEVIKKLVSQAADKPSANKMKLTEAAEQSTTEVADMK